MDLKPNISRLWQLLEPPNGADVVDKNGKVLPPSSTVFKDLSNALMVEYPTMTPKNIYTIILSRRHNVYDQLVAALGIVNANMSTNSKTLDSSANDSMAGIIEFNIDVTELWPQIQPESVTYEFQDGRKRDMYCLRRHSWTSRLYEKIWAETKMPCAISFRNAKISGTGIFATISGKCPECDCEFLGRIANKPQPDVSILMECTIQGFDPVVKHVKKRQLKGETRTAIAKQLVESSRLPCQWRRAEADRLMIQLGEKEPPHLYSGKVLRKAKQERQDKLLDIQSNNIFESLHLMMYSEKYDGAIKRIGLNPLTVMYWSKEQEAVYDHYHDTVYIDGTGSLIKKLKLPNGDLCPHIYLYQIVTQIDDKTAPIVQMLSSAQSTDDILMWLRVFLKTVHARRSVIRVPKECVTDFDKALLGAVAQAFGQVLSLKQYLIICFDLLTNNVDTNRVPPCLIRLDICHFSNMLAKWKCFNDKHPQVRKFYLRAVAILRKQETLEKFTEIATAILMLALNHNGQSGGHVEQSRNFLAGEIRGSSSVELEENIHDDEGTEVIPHPEIDGNYMVNSNLSQWVETLYGDILEQIEAEKDTIEINGYHCPKFAKKLKVLLVYFPLFSEVMRGVFRYGSVNATSAAVESEFNDLKHRTFKNVSLPLRVDKFVARHILSLPGKLKIAMAGTEINSVSDSIDKDKCDRHSNPEVSSENRTYQEQDISTLVEKEAKPMKQDVCPIPWKTPKITAPLTDVEGKENEGNVIDLEEMRAEHNWRNKNPSWKKTFRYADPCPWINTNTTYYTDQPIIPNGNRCSVVRDKGQSFIVRNTCSFDSLCQIIAFTASHNIVYRNEIKNHISPIFSCVNELLRTGLSTKFYSMRVNTLNIPQLKPENRRNRIIQIVATANIADMATWMFKDDPSCIIEKRCATCEKESVKSVIVMSINFEMWMRYGAIGLPDVLHRSDSRPRLCCGELPMCDMKYGLQLIIDIAFGGDKLQRLRDFPDRLTMARNTVYQLAGIVVYEGLYNPNSIGHYIAYVKTGSTWLLFDDLKAKAKPQNIDSEIEVQAHLCIYVRV